MQLMLGAGYYDLPDVKNTRLNKSGMESYCQFNAEVRKTFEMNNHTIEFQLTLVKATVGRSYGNPGYRIPTKNRYVPYKFYGKLYLCEQRDELTAATGFYRHKTSPSHCSDR